MVKLKPRRQWIATAGGAMCMVLGAVELLYANAIVFGVVALAFGGVVLSDSVRPVVLATRESLQLRQFLRYHVVQWDMVDRFVVRRSVLFSWLGVELTDGTIAECRAAQSSSKSRTGQAQLLAWVQQLNGYRESLRWPR